MTSWSPNRRGQHFKRRERRVSNTAAVAALIGAATVAPGVLLVGSATAGVASASGTTATTTSPTTAPTTTPSTAAPSTSTTTAPSTTTTTVPVPATTVPTTVAPVTTTTTVPATTTTTDPASLTPPVPPTTTPASTTTTTTVPPRPPKKKTPTTQPTNVAPPILRKGQAPTGPAPAPVLPAPTPQAPLPVLRRALVVTDGRGEGTMATVVRLLRRDGVRVETVTTPLTTVSVHRHERVGPSVGFDGLRLTPHVLESVVVTTHRSLAAPKIDRRIHRFRPQVVVLGAPASYARPVDALMGGLPHGTRVIWAQDPTPSVLRSDRLARPDGGMLSHWGHLSIVSPGVFLAGDRGSVTTLYGPSPAAVAAAHVAALLRGAVGTVALTSAVEASAPALPAATHGPAHLSAAGAQTYAESVLDVADAAWRLPRLPVETTLSSDSAGLVAVAAAESRIGDPYVWAAAGPDEFDCSGLVMWAYAHAGIALPHYSGSQYADTVPVSMDALEPGDLLFPADPGEHVAMYVGDGKIIQAPYTGATVQVIPLAETGNFFQHAGRVVTDQTVGVTVGQQSLSTVQSYALGRLEATRGWGVAQWPYLDMLWQRESGWQVDAENPLSGAYGIAQALPAVKMASAGPDYLTDPETQIDWGLYYIAGRYGSPKAAWAHELAYGWY